MGSSLPEEDSGAVPLEGQGLPEKGLFDDEAQPDSNDEQPQDDDDEEEEEEEDEEEAERIRQGFIVDELPEREGDDENEDDDDEEEEEEEEEAGLDEDDLDLIAENMGIAVVPRQPAPASSGFRRLKKASQAEDGDLFGRDSDADGSQGSLEEEEQEDIDGREWLADEDLQAYGMHPETVGMISDIFGDVGSVLEILGRRRPREDDAVDVDDSQKPPPAKKWGGGAHNVEFAEGEFLTDSDEAIRRADLPERLAVQFGTSPTPVQPDILEKEAAWITQKLMVDWGFETSLTPETLHQLYLAAFGQKSNYYDPERTTVAEDVRAKTVLVLQWLVGQHLEIPFIWVHRSYLVYPPLNERALWLIYELHCEWTRLQHVSEHLLALLNKVADDSRVSQYKAMLTDFQTEQDLDDVRSFLLFTHPHLFEEVSTKRRQSSAADSLRPIRKFSLEQQWRPHLLDSHQFGANLSKSEGLSCLVTGQQPSASADLACDIPPPPGPSLPGRGSEGVSAWLMSLRVGPFSTASRVLEALLSYEARQLAVNPTVRKHLREWFLRHAAVTAFPKQEMAAGRGRRHWITLGIFKKPALEFSRGVLSELPPPPSGPGAYEQRRLQLVDRERECREAIAFLELLREEQNGSINLVIHPLDSTEPAPWRSQDDEGSIKKTSTDMNIQKYTTADQQDYHDIQRLLSVLSKLYSAPNGLSWATEIQSKILHRLVVKELLPLFRRELRRFLQRRAETIIAALCRDDLLWRLSMKPYRKENGKPFYDRDDDESDDSTDDSDDDMSEEEDDDDDENSAPSWTPRVVGLVIERLNPGIRVHAVATNRHGMPVATLRLDRLLIDDRLPPRRQLAQTTRDQQLANVDRASLKTFLLKRDVAAEIVVIGAADLLARALFEIVDTIRCKVKGKRSFALAYGSLEVPRIFAASELCPKDFLNNYGTLGCQAIGLCRNVQDPLASHLSLWSEAANAPNLLLHLKYHPLQSMLPRERLEFALLQAAQTAVASVGVDLNAIRPWPHLQAPLQFVPGLGPRKAPMLLSMISGGFFSRAQLRLPEASGEAPDTENTHELSESARRGVGPVVLLNCSSFIRLSQEVAMDADCPDPLGCTRIHPTESYASAYKMARDALEDAKSTAAECVAAVLANPSCLEELDLEAYSIILHDKGQPRILPHLEMVRKELDEPYKDPRFPFESMNGLRLFYHLTQEDPYDFQIGAEASATVIESRNGSVRMALQPSMIPAEPSDLPDYLRQEIAATARRGSANSWDRPPIAIESLLPVGSVVPCRLKSIDASAFTTEVVLSHDAAAMLIVETLRRELPPGLVPSHLSVASVRQTLYPSAHPPAASLTAPVEAMTASGSRSLHRRIQHPRFRPTSLSSVILAELRRARVGEALFAQSPTSSEELLLFVRVCRSPFLAKALVIHESDKKTPGRILHIGTQKFMDLDQILGQYVEALRVNLNEVYTFEKYRSGDSVEAVENTLLAAQEAKLASSGASSIEWGITIDVTYPSYQPGVRFHLIAIPPQQSGARAIILKDGIYVSHEGFKLWTHKERSLRRLTNWWKTEGYFQRKTLLAEYNAVKRQQRGKMQEQKQEQLFLSQQTEALEYRDDWNSQW